MTLSRTSIACGLLHFCLLSMNAVASSPAHSVPVERAEIVHHKGNPVIAINGEPTYFASHYIRNYRRELKSRWAEGVADSVRQFNARGVHRFELQIDSGWHGIDGFNPNGTAHRYAYPADAAIRTVVATDPQAQIVLRIGIKMVTKAWKKAHPDEIDQDSRGRSYSVSFASDIGFAAIEQAYRHIVTFVESAPYAGHIVGYNLFLEYEGHPWGALGFGAFTDCSPAMQLAFRRFLKSHYSSDAALQAAWGSPRQVFFDAMDQLKSKWRHASPDVERAMARCLESWDNAEVDHHDAMADLAALWPQTRAAFENILDPYARRGVLPEPKLATATVPNAREFLGGDPRYVFHHPVHSRKVRDYFALLDTLVVGRHRQIARAVREASKNRKLVGMMGGYSLVAGQPRSVMSTTGFPELQLSIQHFIGPGYCGQAFQIPEIDFYFSPTDYLNTGMGGSCLVLNLPASLRLHGKVAWVEDDQRTHLHDHWSWNPGLQTAHESIMVHRRNMALLYTEAGAHDWMEMIQRWLLDEEILANIEVMNRELRKSTTNNPHVDAICVLFDEESQAWSKPTTLLDELLIWQQRSGGLAHCGIPVRYHLLSDLAHDDFPAYKTFLLPNAYHITPEKNKLLNRIRGNGNVLLWLYGAGYVGDRELSDRGTTAVTGMRIRATNVSWEHRVRISNFEHPITQGLPANLTWGTTRHFAPIFRVEDPEATVLGRSFGNAMAQPPGLAIKEFGLGARGRNDGLRGSGDYASVYCEAPNLPAELLREIARYAGTHVYLDSNDFLTAGKDIVMVHSAKPGPRKLRLPKPSDVSDLFTGTAVGQNTEVVPVEIPRGGGTVVLRLEGADHD